MIGMKVRVKMKYLSSILIPLILLFACNNQNQVPIAPTATLPPVVAFEIETVTSPTPVPPTATLAEAPTVDPATDLLGALRQGGYVIFFRHAATHRSQLDVDQKNLENCETQRNLNEEGRAQSEAIGRAFQQAEIPVGAVLASPYCRTRDTAQLAFGRVELSDDLIAPYSKEDEVEVAELAVKLRALLATPPKASTNTILVSHSPNLLEATGLSIIEGEAAIFRPGRGGQFALIAHVLPDTWSELVE